MKLTEEQRDLLLSVATCAQLYADLMMIDGIKCSGPTSAYAKLGEKRLADASAAFCLLCSAEVTD